MKRSKRSEAIRATAEMQYRETEAKRGKRMIRSVQVDLARAGGVYERMARLLSAAHILMSQAGMLFDEVSEYASKYRVDSIKLLQSGRNMQRDLDAYHNEFTTYMDEGSFMDLAKDLDVFRAIFFKFCGMEQDWHPDKEKMAEEKKRIEDKFNIGIHLGYDGMVNRITFNDMVEH